MMETKIGVIDDFFAKINVVAIKLEGDISVGDTIHIKGHTTDITLAVDSMQVEHQSVQSAKKGDSIGIKINERARKDDIVYKVT
ncbi:MAG: hypothetical protein AUJ85_02415 [Elusimicrobia bacterium CG1_02_37_114]|nr:MAG: hypothetical protein AUJ85_02415 [Elusimicrobia bacterium CG1_02_37_114]